MSISRTNYLIIGFDYGDTLEEDELYKLSLKIKCDIVSYNDGYDEPCKSALVPKNSENITEYTYDELQIMVRKALRIKDDAELKGIILPSIVIKSVTLTD
jgi:hypothetical protein